jgi:hypothetical protein
LYVSPFLSTSFLMFLFQSASVNPNIPVVFLHLFLFLFLHPFSFFLSFVIYFLNFGHPSSYDLSYSRSLALPLLPIQILFSGQKCISDLWKSKNSDETQDLNQNFPWTWLSKCQKLIIKWCIFTIKNWIG